MRFFFALVLALFISLQNSSAKDDVPSVDLCKLPERVEPDELSPGLKRLMNADLSKFNPSAMINSLMSCYICTNGDCVLLYRRYYLSDKASYTAILHKSKQGHHGGSAVQLILPAVGLGSAPPGIPRSFFFSPNKAIAENRRRGNQPYPFPSCYVDIGEILISRLLDKGPYAFRGFLPIDAKYLALFFTLDPRTLRTNRSLPPGAVCLINRDSSQFESIIKLFPEQNVKLLSEVAKLPIPQVEWQDTEGCSILQTDEINWKVVEACSSYANMEFQVPFHFSSAHSSHDCTLLLFICDIHPHLACQFAVQNGQIKSVAKFGIH